MDRDDGSKGECFAYLSIIAQFHCLLFTGPSLVFYLYSVEQ